MYRDVPFGVESMEQIEKDLTEARAFAPGARRVFLESGDPFDTSQDQLSRAIIAGICERCDQVEPGLLRFRIRSAH